MAWEEALRRSIVDWNEGGIDAYMEHLTADCEWHAPPDYPDGEVWRGREAIRTALHDQFGDAFSGSRVEIVEAMLGPEALFVALRQTARGRGSGVTLDWQVFFASEMEGDQARVVRVFFNRDDARRAAGLEGGKSQS
jgi:SnoaL-like domain